MNYYKRRLGNYARGWHKFDVMRPSYMPALPACYAIYWNGNVVYIGQSVDLRSRFYMHKFRHGYGKNIITPWGDAPENDTFIVKANFSGRFGMWAMREIRLISRLSPIFNVQHKKRRS